MLKNITSQNNLALEASLIRQANGELKNLTDYPTHQYHHVEFSFTL